MVATVRTPAWIAVLCAALASCDGPPPRPEHVLLVLVDTLRADHLGSLGHPRSPTPAIDSVAARGALFEQAYAQSSWTSPSIVSLFTGRRLAEDRLDLPAGLPTLAESFQTAGWATGAFIMNDMVHERQGFARGFDRFVQMVPYFSDNQPILDWLAAHAAERAFTYVHLNEVHDPYLAPDGHVCIQASTGPGSPACPGCGRAARQTPDPLPPEERSYYERVTRELALQGELEAEVRHIETERGGYVDDVRYTDARIGGLLEGLEELGLAERTCVVITADHGEGLWTRVALMTGQRRNALAKGEPPRLSNTLMPTHGNQVNRELLHVPWVISGPGVPAGVRVRGPVELVDLFPTLLDLCDLPRPDGLEGTSRLSSLRGRAQAPAEVFAQTRFCSTLIAPDGWQVIVPTALGECEEGLGLELYHLPSDPEARANRAGDEGPRLADMVARAQELRRAAVWSAGRPDGPLGPDSLKALHDLGYVESGVVDLGPGEELLGLDIAELVRRWSASGPATDCTERRALASALAARKDELDAAGLEQVRARLALETSAAVRAELELE